MCGSQDLSTRRGWSAVCMSWQLGLPATDNNCVCAARCCPCLLEIQKPRRERDLGLRYGYMSVFMCLSGHSLSDKHFGAQIEWDWFGNAWSIQPAKGPEKELSVNKGYSLHDLRSPSCVLAWHKRVCQTVFYKVLLGVFLFFSILRLLLIAQLNLTSSLKDMF